MPEPILLPDGTAVTGWNADTIEVSGPSGKALVARAAAPAALQQAVAQAESGGGAAARLVPSTPTPNPFGNIDPHTPAPGVNIPRQGATAPAAPADPALLNSPSAPQMPDNPMAAVTARIAELRSQPQVAMGGGGTRTATSTTRMPAAAAAEVRDMQTPIDESVAEQQIAIEEQAGTESGALSDVSKLHAEQGQRIERELADQQTLKADYEKRFAAEQQKLAELNQKAQTEIDPQHYWKEKGTGNKVLAAISMALGAFVNARSEGRVANTPQQIINAAIERDIDAQLENRNRAERDVSRQAGFVGMLGDKYSDDLQKRQAALVLANEAVAKQIDGISAGMQSEQAKAKAMQLSAQLRQANAQRAQEFAAQIAGSETTTVQQVPGGPVKTRSAREADALSEAAYGPGGKWDAETYIPASMATMGEHRAALSKSDQVDINKKAETVQNIQRKIDKIEAAAKDGAKLSPEKKTAIASLYASLQFDIKNAVDAGALDEGTDVKTKEVIGPKPSDLTTISSGLPTLRSEVGAGWRSIVRNRTRPVDPESVPYAYRVREGGGSAQTAAPPTRPLAVEGEE